MKLETNVNGKLTGKLNWGAEVRGGKGLGVGHMKID